MTTRCEFKIKAHLKYLQDVARSYLCPMPLYIWWFDIFQKGIDSEGYWWNGHCLLYIWWQVL